MSDTDTAPPEGRQPSSEVGIYLYKHEHDWREVGAQRYPVGTWHPVFRCTRCQDVICDLHVEVDQPEGYEEDPNAEA